MTNNLEIYSDGGARGNPGPAAAAFVIIKHGKIVTNQSRFLGIATNNVAEYQGVIMALGWLANNSKRLSEKSVSFYLDSELVVNQLHGKYKVKSRNIKPLIQKIKVLESEIGKKISYNSIPRDMNKLADHLVNKTLNENS